MQVDSEYMAPGVAALYLLVHNERVAIIDTGTRFSVPSVLAALKARGLDETHVDYVVPTHVHLDHAGGAGELMHCCPGAKLVVHPLGARHLIDPAKLIAGSKAVYGEEKFLRLYGELRPVPEARVIEAPDRFQLELAGRRLLILDTPGHARHHFCVYDETSGGIFSGDAFGVSYPRLRLNGDPYVFATTTPVQFDPEAMIASIDRLMALDPQRLFLTHYGEIRPTAAIAEQLKQTVRDFRQIALEEERLNHSRLERLQNRLREYLLEALAQRRCPLSVKAQQQVIQLDVDLNAQGLDVWLSRRQTAPAS